MMLLAEAKNMINRADAESQRKAFEFVALKTQLEQISVSPWLT